MKRMWRSVALTAAVVLAVLVGSPASADPAPGFQFDPVKLEASMDACMEYRQEFRDIASIYTSASNDWTGCANGS